MKKEGTAPEAHTTAPARSACMAIGACCECGSTSTCKTARCECRKADCTGVSCQCLGQCANVAPQTQQEKQWMTQGTNTEETGTGNRKSQRRRTKGEMTRTRAEGERKGNGPIQDQPTPPQRTATRRAERQGWGNQKPEHADRKVERGDAPGYTPTPEDLRLREVYGEWVHVIPGTHLDGGNQVRHDVARAVA